MNPIDDRNITRNGASHQALRKLLEEGNHMFRKILVPVDGSKHSERALSLVRELAEEFDSEVLVLRVREKSVGRGGSWDVDLREEDVDIAGEAAQKLASEGVKAKSERPSGFHGNAARSIIRAAGDNKTDAIVMGSRGLSDWRGLLVGSVTHKVLRMASCPVVVVR